MNEPFTKQERLTYGCMAMVCVLGVAAFYAGVDLIPIMAGISGLFAGINLPSPFDKDTPT